MSSTRMQNALQLADKCWEKAYKTAPDFVEQYLEVAEQLLSSRPVVTGDEFRRACRDANVFKPIGLHPNVWVSGVRALSLMGWITQKGKVTPTQSHNHMPVVTEWTSNLYGTGV